MESHRESLQVVVVNIELNYVNLVFVFPTQVVCLIPSSVLHRAPTVPVMFSKRVVLPSTRKDGSVYDGEFAFGRKEG